MSLSGSGQTGCPGLGGHARRSVAALVAIALVCVPASTALASGPSYTWAGASELNSNWSSASNWAGGLAPTATEAIGTLTFSQLTSPSCTAEPPTDTCYLSYNNVSGLTAESVQLDNGDDYYIGAKKSESEAAG
jgi:hypothetical protein